MILTIIIVEGHILKEILLIKSAGQADLAIIWNANN